MKSIIQWLDNYNRNQFVFYWNLVYFLAVVLIIIALFFILYLRKFLKAVSAEKKARELLNSVVKVRENERLNVALEIHDTIIQDLVFSRMLCTEILNSDEGSKKQNELSELTNSILKSIHDVRDISASLRPPEFEKDITEIISSYIENFKLKTDINVEYSFNGVETIIFDNPLKLSIYRIIQESLINVKKTFKSHKC